MFAIPWNFPFRKKDGSISTIGDEMGSGGGSTYELPTASASTKGGVKVGAGLTMDGEVLKNTNPTPYSLPTASASTLGGIKIGDGLSIDDGVLSVSGGSGGSGSLQSFFVNTSIYLNNATYTKYDISTSQLPSGARIVSVVLSTTPSTTNMDKIAIAVGNVYPNSNKIPVMIYSETGGQFSLGFRVYYQ